MAQGLSGSGLGSANDSLVAGAVAGYGLDGKY